MTSLTRSLRTRQRIGGCDENEKVTRKRSVRANDIASCIPTLHVTYFLAETFGAGCNSRPAVWQGDGSRCQARKSVEDFRVDHVTDSVRSRSRRLKSGWEKVEQRYRERSRASGLSLLCRGRQRDLYRTMYISLTSLPESVHLVLCCMRISSSRRAPGKF